MHASLFRSVDGLVWAKPSLHADGPLQGTNVVSEGDVANTLDGSTIWLDLRPGTPPDERYAATQHIATHHSPCIQACKSKCHECNRVHDMSATVCTIDCGDMSATVHTIAWT